MGDRSTPEMLSTRGWLGVLVSVSAAAAVAGKRTRCALKAWWHCDHSASANCPAAAAAAAAATVAMLGRSRV